MGKEVMVEKMSVENGSIDMSLSGESALNFMNALVQFFLQSGAENFITIEMQDGDGHKYGITVQDCNKEETPTAKLDRQQQEIERLNKVLDDWKYNAKCDADHIAGLLADKDEQTDEIGRLQMTVDLLLGRVKQLEKVAKDLYFAYINKEPDCPHEFEIKAIEQYKALLGGKEDEK